MMTWMGGRLNSRIKIDDIMVMASDRILDLKGNVILKLNQDDYNSGEIFVSTTNDRYATYSYGTLSLSDGKKCTEVFHPFLSGKDGKVNLNYMYFSPGKNAIMLCSLPF